MKKFLEVECSCIGSCKFVNMMSLLKCMAASCHKMSKAGRQGTELHLVAILKSLEYGL